MLFVVFKELVEEWNHLEAFGVNLNCILLIHFLRRRELIKVVSMPEVLVVSPNVFEGHFHLAFIKLTN